MSTLRLTPLVILLLMFFAGALPASAPKSLHIMVKMIPEQREYFIENILKPYEQKTGIKIRVSDFKNNWDLKNKLAYEDPVDVVKVPLGMAHTLVYEEHVKSLSQSIPGEKIKQALKDYFLMKLCVFNDDVYYIPRKYETRIMVYRRSKVQDAVDNWVQYQFEIKKRLVDVFNESLPRDYKLEADPNEWTWLDLFVVGYYWSKTSYQHTKHGRIAHRGKNYSGTAVGLMDKCIQAGASTQSLVYTNTKYYHQVLLWESLFAGNGIYHSQFWEAGWDGRDLWNALGENRIFLSYLTQIDVHFLRSGTANTGKFQDLEDLDFALIPEQGYGRHNGQTSRAISTGGWLWGVGARSPSPGPAYDLIMHITSKENQLAESKEFGILPVRSEILKTPQIKFGEKWKMQLYNISVKQLKLNIGKTLPNQGDMSELEKDYIALWKKVVTSSQNAPLNKQGIKFIQKKHFRKN